MSGYTTLTEISSYCKSALKDLYHDAEIRNFCYLIAEYLLNYSKIEFHTKADEPISAEKQKKIDAALKRLVNGEPIQYVLGVTEFCGLVFKVDRRVLVPRPETEELVNLVVHEEKGEEADILEIGTGSGCIAVALDRLMDHAKVFACDVSEDALEVAAVNNETHHTEVIFFRHDILDDNVKLPSRYHVVVSNPPYVRQSEKIFMHKNVLDFEPEMALFVPDEDPLLFYRSIAGKCCNALHKGGRLYLEINEEFPREVSKLLESFGYNHIQLKYDINRRPRFIHAAL